MDNPTLVDRSARQHRALQALADYRAVMDTRDGLIRDAVAAGVSKAVIARIIGVSRQHVYVMLARTKESPGRE